MTQLVSATDPKSSMLGGTRPPPPPALLETAVALERQVGPGEVARFDMPKLWSSWGGEKGQRERKGHGLGASQGREERCHGF